jgi:hypothetical protein
MVHCGAQSLANCDPFTSLKCLQTRHGAGECQYFQEDMGYAPFFDEKLAQDLRTHELKVAQDRPISVEE